MPRVQRTIRTPKKERGIWHVWGMRINLNTILTTLIGAALISLGSCGLKGLGKLQDYAGHLINTVNTLEGKVSTIEKRQERFEKEYAPPVNQ